MIAETCDLNAPDHPAVDKGYETAVLSGGTTEFFPKLIPRALALWLCMCHVREMPDLDNIRFILASLPVMDVYPVFIISLPGLFRHGRSGGYFLAGPAQGQRVLPSAVLFSVCISRRMLVAPLQYDLKEHRLFADKLKRTWNWSDSSRGGAAGAGCADCHEVLLSGWTDAHRTPQACRNIFQLRHYRPA